MKFRKYPKGVSEFCDRHGTVRIRGRRAGQATYYFKSRPPGDEFEAELRAWLAGDNQRVKSEGRGKAGTISYLIAKYYRSADFWKLEPSTQTTYKGILERFRVEHGEKSIAGLGKKKNPGASRCQA